MKKSLLIVVSAITVYITSAQDTLRVMSYNLLDFPAQVSSRADTLKKIIDHVVPDIFMVCELTSQTGANLILNNALNTNGRSGYQQAVFTNGPDTDNLLFYNTTKLGLKSQHNIVTVLRDINEYVLYYKSADIATTNDTTFFYCYIAHLKASTGNETQRQQEAQYFRNYFNTRSGAENVMLGGDFNLYTNTEPAVDVIMTGGSTYLYDPVNKLGNWHNNASYASEHTQSTRNSTGLAGGSSGGLDDRFDFIFISDDLNTGSAHAMMVPGSYHAVGQDGLHYNKAINDSPSNLDVPISVANALFYMSDHLPVMMDVAVGGTIGVAENNPLVSSYSFSAETNQIKINLKKITQDVQLNVFDMSGKLVYSDTYNSVDNINTFLPEFNHGMYLLNLQSGEKSSTFKFIK